MSKIMTVFLFNIACLFCLVTIVMSKKHTTVYDNLNIDEILSNERLLRSYVKCILDEGPCTVEGKELKKDIPDALVNNCKDCGEAQKTIIRKASKHLIESRPEDWKKIEQKFDPERKFDESFTRFLNEN